jgi:uncharacterized Tic20 family protein
MDVTFPSKSGIMYVEGVMNITSEERTWAMLAHLLTLLGYTIGIGAYVVPLVIYFVYKDKSQFVAFHALQALYFRLLTLVGYVIGIILSCILIGIPLLIALGIVELVYTILLAVRANNGELAEYPIAGGWARKSIGI